MRRGARGLVVGVVVLLLAGAAWWWTASLVPGSTSVTEMGYADPGGGPAMTMGPARSVDDLREPDAGPPAVDVVLVARRQVFRLPSGQSVDGYTVNGSSPGPEIRARQGELVQVRLVNESVPDGVALHWHGIDVPGAEDGVAGVTQDAVRPGQSFVYRFRARQAGTYWYHSHQVSDAQVRGGLFGAVVVEPSVPPAAGTGTAGTPDVTALAHLYDGRRTINGRVGDVGVPAAPGTRVRVRVVDTDNGAVRVWSPSDYRVLAVDGTEVHDPTPLSATSIDVPAGGRADLEVTAPARVEVGAGSAVVVGDAGPAPPGPAPARTVDLLAYGSPAPIGLDPSRATRRFEYAVGRRFDVLDGRPGLWWTVNGHLYPDVPMFVVSEGDVVLMHVSNTSGEIHPMHLHGHHAVVLARDGRPATGSPWWVDTLDVADGASYDLAFVADNPGLWMDHCHNLGHAAQGLLAHVMYSGVTTPHRLGPDTGNDPE